jgi:hypothetical protein
MDGSSSGASSHFSLTDNQPGTVEARAAHLLPPDLNTHVLVNKVGT